MQVFAENPEAPQSKQGQADQLYLARLQSDPKRVIKATYREYSPGERIEIESINAEYRPKRLALSASMKQELEGKFRITLSQPGNIAEIFRQCALTLCDLLDRHATDHGRNELGLFYQDSLVSSNISKTYELVGGKGLPYGVQKAYIEKFVSLEIERQNRIENIGKLTLEKNKVWAHNERIRFIAEMKEKHSLDADPKFIENAMGELGKKLGKIIGPYLQEERKMGRGPPFQPFPYEKHPEAQKLINSYFSKIGGEKIPFADKAYYAEKFMGNAAVENFGEGVLEMNKNLDKLDKKKKN